MKITDVQEKEILFKVHQEVIGLTREIAEVINRYLVKESPGLLSANERFLVASRSINYHSKWWYDHFHSEFNAEKSLKKIMDRAQLDDNQNDESAPSKEENEKESL